eukprot:COSAG01_NODE_11888_length_1840_cov_5.093050_2_plen_455_part_01
MSPCIACLVHPRATGSLSGSYSLLQPEYQIVLFDIPIAPAAAASNHTQHISHLEISSPAASQPAAPASPQCMAGGSQAHPATLLRDSDSVCVADRQGRPFRRRDTWARSSAPGRLTDRVMSSSTGGTAEPQTTGVRKWPQARGAAPPPMPAAEAPGSLRKGNDGFLWRSTMCGLNYRWQPSKAPLIGTLGRQPVDEAKAHTTGVSQEGIDDACGGEQALPAAAAAAPQAECTNRRPVWAFDTAWGWKQVKKRTVDGKLGYWHHKHSGPDKGRTLSLGTKVAYTKDKPAGPPTEATPTFAGQGDKQWFYGGWVVEPRWVQLPAVPIERRGLSRRWDSRTRARDGSEWVQVRHNKQQRMFVFTRGDREMVLRKGASVVCTEATPTGAAAHSTYEFPGYVDWKKRPMEAARKRLNNYDWLRKAAPRKRPQAGGTAPPDAKKARSGGGEAEPASKARPT